MTDSSGLSIRARKAVRRALWRKRLRRDLAAANGSPVDGVKYGDVMAAEIARPAPCDLSCTPLEVARLTSEDLLELPNCGVVTLHQVEVWLAAHGLTLGDCPSPSSASANVYADWLEENGESAAVAKLRAAFPLDDGGVP